MGVSHLAERFIGGPGSDGPAPVSEQTLRFERTSRPWVRYGFPVLCAVLVTFALVTVVVDHHWGPLLSACGALLSWVSFWSSGHTRTVVTRDRITVQAGFRKRHIPTSQVAEITQRTAWSPVRARLVSDERVVLPRVEDGDVAAIKELIHPVVPPQ